MMLRDTHAGGWNTSLTCTVIMNILLSATVGSVTGVAVFVALGRSTTPHGLHRAALVHPDHTHTTAGAVETVQQAQAVTNTPVQLHQHDVSALAAAAVPSVQVQPTASTASNQLPLSTGWYVHPKEGEFNAMAAEANTDKVSTHNYGVLYSRAFHLPEGKPRVKKMLEIGLGCNMAYGPGASAKLWRNLFPDAEIWFAEYDGACVNATRAQIDALGIKVVVGDQADLTTLRQWVAETGGGFDLIVDDGGHLSHQQIASFRILFQHALKPGGLYVIEDLEYYIGSDESPGSTSMIHDWLDAFMGYYYWNRGQRVTGDTEHRFKLPPRLRSIECMLEACAFVKCYTDDERCTHPESADPDWPTKWPLTP